MARASDLPGSDHDCHEPAAATRPSHAVASSRTPGPIAPAGSTIANMAGPRVELCIPGRDFAPAIRRTGPKNTRSFARNRSRLRAERHDPSVTPSPARAALQNVRVKPSPTRAERHDPGVKPSPTRAERHDAGVKPSPTRAERHEPGARPRQRRTQRQDPRSKRHRVNPALQNCRFTLPETFWPLFPGPRGFVPSHRAYRASRLGLPGRVVATRPGVSF
jgi:hypothetical protein